jgi:CRP/FNR family transcriptional regulator, cyclic AMP receptor protein
MAVKTDPTESLRRVPLFSGLDRKELDMLSKLIREQRYDAGSTIVKAGAGGHGLYIIKEGTVEVIRDGQRVASMGPGQFFGEISVLDGGPRTADVQAQSETVCLTLVSWEVKPLLMDNPSLTYKMLLEMVKRLRSQAPREHD